MRDFEPVRAITPNTIHTRHTVATMLLVLKVPLPAVMEIMGWPDANVSNRVE
jgi:hypothetical protein